MNASSPRYPSTSARSSSGLWSIRAVPGLGELGFDLLREVGELGQHLDRGLGVLLRRQPLQLVTRRLQPFEQLLGAPERLVG